VIYTEVIDRYLGPLGPIDKLAVTCHQCGRLHTIDVDHDARIAWQDGLTIQRAFPEMTGADRELFVSGTCGECFDELFGDTE